ncbi:MAG: biotin carboxylase N-terminal domain-containing protein [Ilumatobacteraceae bacterium]|nr:biotin carboxylase N-terminal domain-containing protein [Ilumatobacteraceae bacterium]
MRILIANRGEIACRIARTAHRMGIPTVGVYSEPDRNALHVDSVDVAVALGGSTPAESYLRGDAVIRVALDHGATAVHPGYGFLAENADFAQAVSDAGLIWIGPTPDQIRLLGDKVAAKRAALEAGVPTTDIIEASPDDVPSGLPMPVLVKAAAGGGGRGMRVVHDAADLPDAVAAAAREAASAFGDGTVFIEPYIERGRHVEVQIFGDTHGNVIHLGDRECSIQRRNQKVVEEAPSPGISDATRRRLHDGALALARHVGYVGAGTVEFMVGDAGDGGAPTITFLEVNTRLQVEHPVTEAITGLDLVEMQIRVADGHPMPLAQDDIMFTGHAIEVRLVAEDPAAGWLPSTGHIAEFDIPGDVRVDTGFRAGSEVSSDYDSLLAKVIAHDADRGVAAGRIARALRGSRIAGVRTNAAALSAIMDEPDFRAGATFTSYLADHPAVESAAGPDGDDRLALLLGGVFADEMRHRAADAVTGFAPSGWRNLRTRGQRRTWLLDDDEYEIEYVLTGDAATALVGAPPVAGADGSLPDDPRRAVAVRLLDRTPDRQVVELDGARHVVDVRFDGDMMRTAGPSGSLVWQRPPRFVDHDDVAAGGGPICPLPGTVIAVHVDDGAEVAEGQLLMVVEAMKMEHRILAPAASTVTQVRFGVGDRVDTGDLLVALDVADGGE